MPFDSARIRQLLKDFNFFSIFIEELGWDIHAATLNLSVVEETVTLRAIAQKRGFVVYHCPTPPGQRIPEYPVRRKIEHLVAKAAHEHLIVFTDAQQTMQIWQWVKRETGKPTACREHHFYHKQSGDALVQKLQSIVFTLEEEETLTLTAVTRRARTAFDVEHVTKKFYDQFKKEHANFLKFISGIPEHADQEWYASVMLSRLMFIYFIQRKGFLDGDHNYLRNRLNQTRLEYGRDKFYSFYRFFLLRLFHDGLGSRQRTPDLEKLLGRIPYLDGGLFERHPIEKSNSDIQIPDEAFKRIFDYFDQYQWHLDERPLRADNEINPDVLGFIFEKYINQKQMGAYYTKEDITEYISKNTVIPFLFDATRAKCCVAFENPGGPTVWDLLRDNPDRYIYPATRHGLEHPLPPAIAAGLNPPTLHRPVDVDPVQTMELRKDWNKIAPTEFALPTETWREVVARRRRYQEAWKKLSSGSVHDINDLITLNLDIRQFAQDVIENCEGPELLRAFWHTIEKVTILDPTCGSGAFLFAALNILEPLYEAYLDRMEAFLADEAGKSDRTALIFSKQGYPLLQHDKYKDFSILLDRVAEHPNRRYFIFKNIILNNLFGVDIMEEAIEICKLRLFLKLAAQVEPEPNKNNLGIEPLPDIDFNIRVGNTLVGFATYDDAKRAVRSKLDFDNTMEKISVKAVKLQQAFDVFRRLQIEGDGYRLNKHKVELRKQLIGLQDELNRYLAGEYGVHPTNTEVYIKWLKSYRPFHWFVEFYGIMNGGGFDVIIGNPPYVEYTKVKKDYTVKSYFTEQSSNLYAFMSERSLNLLTKSGGFGFIVPISVVCTQRMKAVQDRISLSTHSSWFSNYAERPSKLFEGAEVLLTIILTRGAGRSEKSLFTTGFTKWAAEERPCLFNRVSYCRVNEKPKPYLIPKLSGQTEVSILEKISNGGGILAHHLQKNSRYRVYYRIGGGRYWKIFVNFQPRFVLNGKLAISSRENYLFFTSETLREATISALSSSLFYWYFILTTNCRDLNPCDLNEFPINLNSFSKQNLVCLGNLCRELMKDYEQKSQLKEKTSTLTGNIVYQEFYPRHSKPILDEIDRVLARHYGFTEEELDFIINYDIKYRMGRDTESEDE